MSELLPPLVQPPPGVSCPVHVDLPPFLQPLQPQADDEQDDSDIYRGERPPSPHRPRPESIASASSSSSSSSSLNVGRRLGALAAVVELAVSRWARAHSSSSSDTSSSSSSTSAPSTTTRTHRGRRRRRYSSTVSLTSVKVLLARKRALEEFRIAPREFVLYLPPALNPGPSHTPVPPELRDQARQQRLIRTESLPLIIAQLDSALKKPTKHRKAEARPLPPPTNPILLPSTQPEYCLNHAVSVHYNSPSEAGQLEKSRKGKHKEQVSPVSQTSAVKHDLPPRAGRQRDVDLSTAEKGWWLDVVSPTWEDMRSLGKILHLHPLTLEDILQQEPREKLELFPKLGYYFIVFRALEGQRSRERFRRFRGMDSEGTREIATGPEDEGVIGAVNVYLIVFREGICSFHFEDISEHADRVRNKVLQLEDTVSMSSGWIAHGILDSIVDSFFPVLNGIEKEVKAVDDLVHNGRREQTEVTPSLPFGNGIHNERLDAEKNVQILERSSIYDVETEKGVDNPSKSEPPFSTQPLTRFSFPLPSSPVFSLRHIRRYIRRCFYRENSRGISNVQQPPSSTSQTLLRMAATRRIVTSLGRLLATKGEVVTQIRKRLLTVNQDSAAPTSGLGMRVSDSGEFAIHMGDVHDHILTLQQSLTHYERMLSHSHPAYLSQLRVSLAQTKGGTDTAILLLSLISMTVLCIQVLLGLFSINIGKIPMNAHRRDAPFTAFYIIVAVSIMVAIGVLLLVRYWHFRAKRKYSRRI